jgi:hypothetical protein
MRAIGILRRQVGFAVLAKKTHANTNSYSTMGLGAAGDVYTPPREA